MKQKINYGCRIVVVFLCAAAVAQGESVNFVTRHELSTQVVPEIASANDRATFGASFMLDGRKDFRSSFGATKISPGRPRLFVRADDDTISRGLTVSQLKAKIQDPLYKDCFDYTGGINGWASLPAVAMNYLLHGDRNDALAVGEYIINNPFSFEEHTSAAAIVYNCAIAFDWVRNGLPDNMALIISGRLVEGAEHLKGAVISPSINHNYSIVSLHGVAMAAMAIFGESNEYDEKAQGYLQLVEKFLLNDNMLFETLKAKQGTWGEGNHYTPFVVFHPLLMTLRGLTTATNRDYFKVIRQEYDDFITPMAKFVIANFRPDFTLERIGDVTGRVVLHKTFIRPLIDLLASESHDLGLQGQLHSFSKQMSDYYGADLVPDVNDWMMLVTYDSSLPDHPSYKTLPKAMRLGEDSYEHIMFRNGWGEDATLITYITGDHYTDHQHFDKGHFLIYKNGGLVVDGGGYSSMYKDSWSNYSTRTLAHNNVLVHDPEETIKKGITGTELHPDGGQRVIRGAQSVRSWREFKEKADSLGLHTADVLAFEVHDAYNYVKSDLTNAYAENVIWMDRQLLYLPDADYFLVKDRVITRKPLHKYWLMHFEERPAIDGDTPVTGVGEYKNASIVHSQRTGELVLEGKKFTYSGSLFVKSLLPENRTISIIGGPGYEYYNRFSKVNFAPEKLFHPTREAGNWRMEVSDEKAQIATAFMHAFEITASHKEGMVPVDYVRSTDRKLDGVFFRSDENPYVVLFSNSLEPAGHHHQQVQLPIKYKVNAMAPAAHVLVELEPDIRVNIYVNGKDIGTFKTSSAGALYFTDQGTGVRKVKVKAWRK